jgi:ribosomal protein S18 acetylase RimI-like enzyme
MAENTLNRFQIVHELTDEHIRQLVAYTKEDTDIRTFTRDDSRFANEEMVKQFTEHAALYILTNGKNLCGIIWFSPKALPDKLYIKDFEKALYTTTFAIRLYGEAKGKGLAFPFMEEAFLRFQAKDTDKQHMWLQTRAENNHAIYLYKKFGFQQVSQADDENRIIMIK